MNNDTDKEHRWIRDIEGEANCSRCGLWYRRFWKDGKTAECLPGACILTGEDGENEDDCTTHEHEET